SSWLEHVTYKPRNQKSDAKPPEHSSSHSDSNKENQINENSDIFRMSFSDIRAPSNHDYSGIDFVHEEMSAESGSHQSTKIKTRPSKEKSVDSNTGKGFFAKNPEHMSNDPDMDSMSHNSSQKASTFPSVSPE